MVKHGKAVTSEIIISHLSEISGGRIARNQVHAVGGFSGSRLDRIVLLLVIILVVAFFVEKWNLTSWREIKSGSSQGCCLCDDDEKKRQREKK